MARTETAAPLFADEIEEAVHGGDVVSQVYIDDGKRWSSGMHAGRRVGVVLQNKTFARYAISGARVGNKGRQRHTFIWRLNLRV